jgi:haloalkane dehalogenase
MPNLEDQGRLIAPDLIGMGDPEKLDDAGHDSYSVPNHVSYLFPHLEELGCTVNITLILHDWGSGLGFHYANTHPDTIKAIAFMEGILTIFPEMADFPEGLQEVIGMFSLPESDKVVLEENFLTKPCSQWPFCVI